VTRRCVHPTSPRAPRDAVCPFVRPFVRLSVLHVRESRLVSHGGTATEARARGDISIYVYIHRLGFVWVDYDPMTRRLTTARTSSRVRPSSPRLGSAARRHCRVDSFVVDAARGGGGDARDDGRDDEDGGVDVVDASDGDGDRGEREREGGDDEDDDRGREGAGDGGESGADAETGDGGDAERVAEDQRIVASEE